MQASSLASPPQPANPTSERIAIDVSCQQVVMLWFASATFWLLVGSALALLTSVKLHHPYFLADSAWFTFGRVRPAHLNVMVYGWASMAGVGVVLWLQARLSRVRLPYRDALWISALYWNLSIACGLWGMLRHGGTSVEWLEMSAYVTPGIGVALLVLFATSLRMLRLRRAEHLYVSQWYIFGAVFWFPFLYISGMLLVFAVPAPGAVKAVANWWFGHNVLGLWLTPIGLATAYYVIPKVLGRPIHSYHLSLLGFWTLAIFYNWAGTHHLIGGPVPGWLISVGVVGSLMMVVPVITVAINHHLTMRGNFGRLRSSPTLRFTVFGAMSYTLVSIQGSLMALRSVNQVTHFTHYTIAHAHLGVYAFFTMVMFGACYYIVPRLTGREWWSARLIRWHFWCTAGGMSVYFLALTWAGVAQGRAMNDAEVAFITIVHATAPYLVLRSVAGAFMTLGHGAFAWLMVQQLRGCGEQMPGPTLFAAARSPLFAQLTHWMKNRRGTR